MEGDVEMKEETKKQPEVIYDPVAAEELKN